MVFRNCYISVGRSSATDRPTEWVPLVRPIDTHLCSKWKKYIYTLILNIFFFFISYSLSLSCFFLLQIFVQKWRNCWRTLLCVLISWAFNHFFLYLYISWFILFQQFLVMHIESVFIVVVVVVFWWPSIWYTIYSIHPIICLNLFRFFSFVCLITMFQVRKVLFPV